MNPSLRVCLLLPVVACCISCNTTTVTYATGGPELAAVKDKRFALKLDCYVFRYVDRRREVPFIAAISSDPKLHVPGLPTTIDQGVLLKEIDRKIILGVVPKGTTFAVTALRYETSFEMGTVAMFEIAPEGPLQRQWPILNALWLTANDSTKPSLRAEAVQ